MNKSFICQHCGASITEDMEKCEYCGCHISFPKPQVVINNYYNTPQKNTVRNVPVASPKAVDKRVSFLLCLFIGYFGAHKFYEGNIGTGLLYLFTCGLFGFGWIIDIFIILSKPNPYYV